MSSNVVKCLKDCFSVRKNSRENKVMICRGRAKKPARVQRGEDYAEQRELKSLSFHGADFFSSIVGSARIPRASCRIYGDIKDASFTFINDTVMRRVGRSESL